MTNSLTRRYDLQLPLDVAVLPLMRAQARRFLTRDAFAEDFVEDIVLCLQEACKNAIRFSGSRRGILVQLYLEPAIVHVVVRDFGVGMAPGAMDVSSAPLAENGRGLRIIRCLMDELEVNVDRGTELRMAKNVPAPGQAPADDIMLCA